MMNFDWNKRNERRPEHGGPVMWTAALVWMALLAGGSPAWAAQHETHGHGAHVAPAGTQQQIASSGVVRGVNPARQTVTLEHEPIEEIGWPAMTMDFEVHSGVALDELEAGERVRFSMVQKHDGSWQVVAIHPARPGQAQSDHGEEAVTVYKLANCGCCTLWANHMRDHGFDVTVTEVQSTASIRQQLGVPEGLDSCHTAVVGDYFVEGHVPADLVERLLADRPSGAAGLTVPGMPHGSPGMESPHPVEYQILLVDDQGDSSVYATRMGSTR